MPRLSSIPMTDSIHLPLSLHQQARFQQMRAEAAALAARQNEAVTTIVAATHDPALFDGWVIRLAETEIVCTPPPADALTA